MIISPGFGKGCWRARSEGNTDRRPANKTSEFL